MVVPVITVDGPAGTGKGTIAAHIARCCGFHLLDSGALYRVLGLVVLDSRTDLTDTVAVAALARSLDIGFNVQQPGSVLLNGEDVTALIRTAQCSTMASRVAAIPQARQALLQHQLDCRKPPGLVADGRDMGTVVFPDAVLKLYLTASLEERARRRYKQLIDKGIDAMLSDLLQDLKERDARDSQRTASPMIPAPDAIVLDTTRLSIEQVAEQVTEQVSQRLGHSR